MKPLRLLVPLDTTVTSVRALEAVRHFAGSVDSCFVELLHIETLDGGTKPDDWRTRQTKAEDFLAEQAASIAARNVSVTCQVAWGDPAEVILAQAQRDRFDFLCMTSRAVPHNVDQPDSVAARLFRDSTVPIIALPANYLGADASEDRRAYYRVPVYLPATIEVDGIKHPLAVSLKNLGAKGAELELESGDPLPLQECLLILSLPTRSEPLELVTSIVGVQHLRTETGGAVQVLHTTFPRISMSQEDAIVAFMNRLRVLEQQQRAASAAVRIDVVTGPRAFANFRGRTTVVRPDYVWLRMEKFDHIESADVTLRVYSGDGRNEIEVDGTVTSVRATDGAFDVEVELAEGTGHANPGERLMAFLRQHYREEAAAAPSGQVLIPRPVRAHRSQHMVARIVTATPGENRVPMRAAKRDSDVPFEKRVRQAEEKAMESILRPKRKSPPLRSL